MAPPEKCDLTPFTNGRFKNSIASMIALLIIEKLNGRFVYMFQTFYNFEVRYFFFLFS